MATPRITLTIDLGIQRTEIVAETAPMRALGIRPNTAAHADVASPLLEQVVADARAWVAARMEGAA